MAVTNIPTTRQEPNPRIDYTATLPHATKLVILGAVLLSLFLAALDQTIVATALPAIVSDFNGLSLVSWVSTGYLLASTAMVPIYGKLSDLYGRKLVLLWGIVVFLLGSGLCGVSQSMIQLIIFRVVQGVGAAAITSTAFATPADLFVPADRPRYMGLFPAVFGLSSVVGPFLGGLLTDQISWHWVFYVNLPLGVIALWFVWTKMPSMASGIQARIDWLGTLLLIGAVVPLLLGLTLDKSVHPWSSPLIIGYFVVAAICTVLFLIIELRAESPVISLALFRNRTFAAGVVAALLSGAAFFGAVLFLSLFLVNVLGLTATEAGIAQIPLMAGFVLASNVSSLLVQRSGRYKPFIVGGFALMIVGFVLMSQLSPDSSVWDVAWRVFVMGVGLGPAMPLLNLAMQNAARPHEIGAVMANRQFFQQFGQVLGGAIFGVILTTTLAGQLQQNFAQIMPQVPPTMQAALDPSQFQSSVSVSEGAGGSSMDLEAKLVQAAIAPIQQQRSLVEAALSGNAEARAQLLSSDQTLPEVKAAVSDSNPAAQEQANGAIDAAEQQVRADAARVEQQVSSAVKTSFATSVTRIYLFAIPLSALALLVIALWLPETPLSQTMSFQQAGE